MCWLLLCVVGQCRYNSDNKMSCGFTWFSEEEKCLIWADGPISQMLDTKRKNSEVYKIVSKQRNERGAERSVEQYCASEEYIKVQDHFVHVDKPSFGPCCQAALVKAICCVCWLSVVFSVQTNCSKVLLRRVHLFEVISTQLFCSTSVCDFCVYMYKRTEPKGKHPLILEKRLSFIHRLVLWSRIWGQWGNFRLNSGFAGLWRWLSSYRELSL